MDDESDHRIISIILTYRRSMAFSPSLFKLKLSRPAHTFTNRLLEKKPEPSPAVSAIPQSNNVFGVMRPFGFGLRSFLKDGKTEGGIEPRDDGFGGGCGGSAVSGGGWVGLKTECRSKPRA